MTILFENIGWFGKGTPHGFVWWGGLTGGYIILTDKELIFKRDRESLLNDFSLNLTNIKEIERASRRLSPYLKITTISNETLTFCPYTGRGNQKRSDVPKVNRLLKLLNELQLIHEQIHEQTEISQIEQIKNIRENITKLLSVSNKIKLDMMRDILQLNKDSFNNMILDWAVKYNFTIDGDYILINKDTLPNFIEELNQLYDYGNEPTTSSSPSALNSTSSETKFCANCGQELNKGAKFCNNCGMKL